MASKDISLQISQPALLLNRIAQRYSRLSRILMEYVDNSLDDAEKLFDRVNGAYRRPISIVVDVQVKPARVTITDNCTGMSNNQLCRLIKNVGESMKHSKFTNGQFGFGVHAFRAACKNLRVCSRTAETDDIHQITINRSSNKFMGCLKAQESGLMHRTGTEVVLHGFDNAWLDGLDAKEIVKEIQYHFDRLLGRRNLVVAVKGAEGMTKCRPYDYRTLRGNKVTETIECGELGNVNVNLWVSNVPVADQGVFFVSQGRRISEISDIKSFMKVSVALWGAWKHPNLCGYIEVGEVLQPVITRDEFTRTSTRGKVYKAIVKEVEPVLAELIDSTNKKRRVLEMGKLGSIISKCFNIAVRNESSREKMGQSYFDHARREGKPRSKKRTLEDLEKEERLALSADLPPGALDGIAIPVKKQKISNKKATRVKHASGKFRMVFVNDLKDAQGNPKRAQLIGDDVYINVQHPDFESRVNYSRKTGKMQISERLCSYLANIAATAYKANIIQRSREGLQKYADSHFQLFDEILDLEFAIENQLRKYLPAIQREVDGADFA